MGRNGPRTSHANLESYVKGGGKVALLVSRDITRVEGSCVRLAKKSGRTLYRWDGKKIESYDKKMIAGRAIGWEDVGPQVDFSKVFMSFCGANREPTQRGLQIGGDGRTDDSPDISFDEHSILWMPLNQPFLIQDGGGGSNGGSRQEALLRQNMEICSWALRREDSSHEREQQTWHGKTLLIGGMDGTLPRELKSVSHIIRWEYPTREDLRDFIFGQVGEYKDGEFQLTQIRSSHCGSVLDQIGQQHFLEAGILGELAEEEFQANQEKFIKEMVENAQGLDLDDCGVAVLSSFREAIEAHEPIMSRAVLNRVMERKVELLSSEGILKVERTHDIEEIGGYNRIVQDIQKLKARFHSSDAEKFGIRKPKGVILTGVPGCGKSLSAKTIATLLECPLIEFDLGKITTSMYGESEENMHKALNMATGMAPCVLWIDEFEKMFSSAKDGGQSHEVSQRMNAIFLKWMEERTNSVFVVATSNDLSGIKAEYQRTGRWDGTYFFDLPSYFERRDIIKNVLRKTAEKMIVSISETELEHVAKKTDGYAGSDIVAIVEEAKNQSFNLWDENSSSKGPTFTFERVMYVLESDKIRPMIMKDNRRLMRIREEGMPYTSASIYVEGDVRPLSREDLDNGS